MYALDISTNIVNFSTRLNPSYILLSMMNLGKLRINFPFERCLHLSQRHFFFFSNYWLLIFINKCVCIKMFHQQVCITYITLPNPILIFKYLYALLSLFQFSWVHNIYESWYLMKLRLRVNTPNIFYNTKDFLSFFYKMLEKNYVCFCFPY